MHKSFIGSFIVAAALACPAFAQDAPKKVQRAVDKLFPDGKAQISAGHEVNGVKTYNATVRSDGAENHAVLTENGDILVSSEQRTNDTPPPAVKRVVDGLFGMDTGEFDAMANTYYMVDANLDGKPYQIRLDATGRVRDVQTRAEMKMSDASSLDKATNDSSQRAEQFVKRWHEGAKIDGVYNYPDAEGFYLVQYDDEDGNQTQTVVNDQGRVYYEFTKLDRDKLPAPVQQTMSEMFKGAKINDVTRAQSRYYQFHDEVRGNAMTVRIRPNGDVVGVSSEAEDEDRAVTAAARSKAKGDKSDKSDRKSDKSDKSDRNRND